MDRQAHVSPLRSAVKSVLRYDVPWSHESVAEMARVSVTAAKRYCTQLVRTHVIEQLEDGRYVAGERASAYRREVPKTHVGGNAKGYLMARVARSALEEEEIRAIQRVGPGDLTSAGAGDVATMETIMAPLVIDPPERGLRPKEAGDLIGVCPRTIRRWLDAGKVKGFRLPSGQMRIFESEVRRIMGDGETQDGNTEDEAD